MNVSASIRDKRLACSLAVACALLFLTACGCTPPAAQSGSADGSAGNGSTAEVTELPTQPEYVPPDPATRGKVRVQVPEGYACSEYAEDMEPYGGEGVELDVMTVDLGDAGSLQVLMDDADFLDSWYGGSAYGTSTVAEYVENATAAGQGSSWPVSIGGHDGVVFIEGSTGAGDETAGSAFVFLDGATVAISAVLPDGEAAPDAYSKFFRSEEIERLLAELTISSE